MNRLDYYTQMEKRENRINTYVPIATVIVFYAALIYMHYGHLIVL